MQVTIFEVIDWANLKAEKYLHVLSTVTLKDKVKATVQFKVYWPSNLSIWCAPPTKGVFMSSILSTLPPYNKH